MAFATANRPIDTTASEAPEKRQTFEHKSGPINISDVAEGVSKFLISHHARLHHSYLRIRGCAEALFLIDSPRQTDGEVDIRQVAVDMPREVMPFLFLSHAYLHRTYMHDFSFDLNGFDRSTVSKTLMPSITTLHLLRAAGLVGINPEPHSAETARHARSMVLYRDRQISPKKLTIKKYLIELAEHESYRYFVYDVDTISSLLWMPQTGKSNKPQVNELVRKTSKCIDRNPEAHSHHARAARKFIDSLSPITSESQLAQIPQELSRFTPIMR